MAGSSGDIGHNNSYHKGFFIMHWAETRGKKIKNFVWQIEKRMSAKWYENPGPEDPVIVSFDAEKKQLRINFEMAKKLGIKVVEE